MKRIYIAFLAALGCVGASAQKLTLEKAYNDFTKSEKASIWAANVDYDSANGTKFGTTDCTNGLSGTWNEGLAFQGPEKWHYFHNGIFNGNGGNRMVGVIDAKAGQRIKVVAATENKGKLNNGLAIYEGANVTLYNYDKLITADYEEATYYFDVVADGPAGMNLTRQGYITSFEVYNTSAYSEEETATYTVKFVDENGTEIKEAVTATGLVGANPEFFIAQYTTSVYSADGTKKYNYASNNFSTINLAKTGSVATVKFQSVAVLNYTINYVDYDSDATIATSKGITFEDEPYVSYKGFVVGTDGTIYGVSENKGLDEALGEETNNFSVKVTSEMNEFDVPIMVINDLFGFPEGFGLSYISEGEDMGEKVVQQTATGLSNGLGGASRYIGGDGAPQFSIELEAGDYALYLSAYNDASNLKRAFNFYYKATEDATEWSVLTQYSDLEMTTKRGAFIAGDNWVYFSVPAEIVDAETGKLSFAVSGYVNSGLKTNQSITVDYFMLLKKGYKGDVTVNGDEEETPEDPETPQAIVNVKADVANGAMYDLSGRRISEAKGMFIMNGKLYIAK